MWNTQSEDLTPMLSQYHALKRQYADCLLFFRLGDFYELFYEDAVVGSKELGLVLTSRPAGKGKERIPMCGVPYHSSQSYISKLVSRGYKVAICEQLEDPSQAKGVVKRDVVRVLTPGTYFEKELTGLACVYRKGYKVYCSYLSPSTGEFLAGRFNRDNYLEFLLKFQPKEILTHEKFDDSAQKVLKSFFTPYTEEDVQEGLELLKKDFNIFHWSGLGFEEEEFLIPCGVAYLYLKRTQKGFTPYVQKPKPYAGEGYVAIDYRTRRGLELLESYEGREDLSLFGVINRTLTGMGRRRLRFRITHPFLREEDIRKVQQAVEELLQNRELLKSIRSKLENMPDLERLASRISGNVATPREFALLKKALFLLQEIKDLLEHSQSELLKDLFYSLEDLDDIYQDIERTLVDDPPIHLKEGGLIKEGVHPQLDELRKLRDKTETILREYEERLRKETGIQSLKVGYNRVMGYYIEVTKPNLRYVPNYFKRRQTLSNSERFTTDELQRLEEKILSAATRANEIEYELFLELRERVLSSIHRIHKNAQHIAEVDYVQSLAQIALEKGWKKPELSKEKIIYIKEGRHPVIEQFSKEYVPNSTYMDEQNLIHIITGPNMAGKSSYIRQVAVLVLLTHMGSFLPCKSARIGLVSSIHARIGSGDVLALGVSTFMNEMMEVSAILNSADERSLIILDEVGRGTSTYDGIAISRAIIEYIAKKIKARTLVATHYLELTSLEEDFPQIKNYHMAVSEGEQEINFLYTLKEGSAKGSFGIYVAKMAGLPEEIITRGYEILSSFDESLPILEKVYENSKRLEEETIYKELVENIEKLDIANITPLKALLILADLKEKITSKKLFNPSPFPNFPQ
ncbi:DNA mismatch repair protein MutS [Thermocrinis sp.]|uniref:DNA mismatch repair protein MutS n=1 Tax=Thermocrinis sp. TaxID=2024383 RepID=UPI002FDEC15F